jgi:hypothetical protein
LRPAPFQRRLTIKQSHSNPDFHIKRASPPRAPAAPPHPTPPTRPAAQTRSPAPMALTRTTMKPIGAGKVAARVVGMPVRPACAVAARRGRVTGAPAGQPSYVARAVAEAETFTTIKTKSMVRSRSPILWHTISAALGPACAIGGLPVPAGARQLRAARAAASHGARAARARPCSTSPPAPGNLPRQTGRVLHHPSPDRAPALPHRPRRGGLCVAL